MENAQSKQLSALSGAITGSVGFLVFRMYGLPQWKSKKRTPNHATIGKPYLKDSIFKPENYLENALIYHQNRDSRYVAKPKIPNPNGDRSVSAGLQHTAYAVCADAVAPDAAGGQVGQKAKAPNALLARPAAQRVVSLATIVRVRTRKALTATPGRACCGMKRNVQSCVCWVGRGAGGWCISSASQK